MVIRRRIGRRIGSGTVGGLVFVGALIAAPNLAPISAQAPNAQVHHDGRPDAGACASDRGRAAAGTGVSPAVGADVAVVVVRVPRTAVIKVDGGGQVVAAWTNTGCAPSAGDDLWIQRPDGTIAAAGADRATLTAFDWEGDFSDAGVFVDQRRG